MKQKVEQKIVSSIKNILEKNIIGGNLQKKKLLETSVAETMVVKSESPQKLWMAQPFQHTIMLSGICRMDWCRKQSS